MKHEYMMRGKKHSVEELVDVVAVKPQTRETDEAALRIHGEVSNKLPGISGDKERQAFLDAGWWFVKPTESARKAALEGSGSADGAGIQRVFVQPQGRLLLGSNRLTVRLKKALTETQALAVLAAEQLDIVQRLKFAPNLYEVRVRPGRDFLAASLELAGKADFEYAEPQFIEHIPGRALPADPDLGQQWHLRNTGQSGGTAGADISAEHAWDMTRGAGVRLCLIDNGIDVAHPDLAGSFTASSGFFVMDAMGNTTFTQGIVGFPNGNHGTFCSGLAVARANNAEGGAGVAFEANLTAVACLNDQVGTQVTLARAISYAADPTQEVPGANAADGADVISCSLGPSTGADWLMAQVMQDAIDFAVSNGRGGLGTPIFWAVTNGNHDIIHDEVCSYAN
ncbi:MAG TPA: S8 family serine peptidase, partial [Polyangiaceae bacterium]